MADDNASSLPDTPGMPDMSSGDAASAAGNADAKYAASVIEIGPMVPELLEAGVLVLFGDQAPPELREIAIIHDGRQLAEPLDVGDVLELGEFRAAVTAVGEMASANLAELGHLVIKANGASEAELPGEISVETVSLIVPASGAALRIQRGVVLDTARDRPASSLPTDDTSAPAYPALASSASSASSAQTAASTDSTRRRTPWGFLSAWLSWRRRGTRSA